MATWGLAVVVLIGCQSSPAGSGREGDSTTPSPAPSGGGGSGSSGSSSAGTGGGGGSSATPQPPGSSASNPAAPAAASPTTPAPSTPAAETHFIGRFVDDAAGGKRFGWPGSTIQAQFTGTDIAVKLKSATGPSARAGWPAGGNSGDIYEVSIDGGAATEVRAPIAYLSEAQAEQASATTLPLAANLAAGTHTVRLQKRTEMRVGTASFVGWQVGGGQVIPSTRPLPRRLLVIGDSISAGYGVLGADSTCRYAPDSQSAAQSWGVLAGLQVGADVHDIAWSGKGVFRNYGDPTQGHGANDNSSGDTMLTLWKQAVAPDGGTFVPWDLTAWVPQVVAINLGTNDFSRSVDASAGFTRAMTTLVQDVLAAYPQAIVALGLGPMLWDDTKSGTPSRSRASASLQQVVAQVTAQAPAAHLEVVDFGALSDGQFGCDGHPNLAAQRAMAAKLVEFLGRVAGWK